MVELFVESEKINLGQRHLKILFYQEKGQDMGFPRM
jgi:hypothetical protein